MPSFPLTLLLRACRIEHLRYKLASSPIVHVRGIERLLDEQVNTAVAGNLRAAGGAAMIWDSVISLIQEVLVSAKESSP